MPAFCPAAFLDRLTSSRPAAPKSRRQFLELAAVAAAGSWLEACGGNEGGNGNNPTKTYTVRLSLIDTFTKNPIAGFNYNLGNGAKSTNGSQIQEVVNAGAATWQFSGGGIEIPRYISANVNGDINATVDAIATGTGFDVENYRQMGLGIGSPYPYGGVPVQRGSSIRLRDGISPHIIVVRYPGIEDIYYTAFDAARSAFPEFTGDIVKSNGIEYVDSAPTSNIPGGAVIVSFSTSGFSASPINDGKYVTYSRINAPNGRVGTTNGPVQPIKHEYGHTLVLDHSSDSAVLMAPDGGGSGGNHGTPTRREMDVCRVKYSRKGGHTLDVNADSD